MSLVEDFGETITIRRMSGNGALVNGVYRGAPTSDSKITASVQVLSANEMLLLPEGDRLKEAIKIYSDVPLMVSSNDNLREADVVFWDNRAFEVQKVEKWQQLDLKHYRSIAMLMQPKDKSQVGGS